MQGDSTVIGISKATRIAHLAAAICGAAFCMTSLAGCKPAAQSPEHRMAAEEPKPRTLPRASAETGDAPPALSSEKVTGVQPGPDSGESVAPLVSLEQRYFAFAEPEIRKLANAMLDILQAESPNLFADYERRPLPDGTFDLVTPYRKV